MQTFSNVIKPEDSLRVPGVTDKHEAVIKYADFQ